MCKSEIQYNDDEGLWHVILIFSGEEWDVATHCEQEEAEVARLAIEAYASMKPLSRSQVESSTELARRSHEAFGTKPLE